MRGSGGGGTVMERGDRGVARARGADDGRVRKTLDKKKHHTHNLFSLPLSPSLHRARAVSLT